LEPRDQEKYDTVLYEDSLFLWRQSEQSCWAALFSLLKPEPNY
jgi:hypothetical protein